MVWCDDDLVKIYDRVCDHNGGKLLFNGEVFICPLHGWILDPATGQYQNVECIKKPTKIFRVADIDNEVKVDIDDNRRVLSTFTSLKNMGLNVLGSLLSMKQIWLPDLNPRAVFEVKRRHK